MMTPDHIAENYNETTVRYILVSLLLVTHVNNLTDCSIVSKMSDSLPLVSVSHLRHIYVSQSHQLPIGGRLCHLGGGKHPLEQHLVLVRELETEYTDFRGIGHINVIDIYT